VIVDTPETTPAVSTETPAAAPATAAVEPASAAPEWDGSWDKLDVQPWWKSVPEGARKHFSTLKERRDYLDDLFKADDAVAPLQTEIGSLKEALGSKDAEIGTWKSKYEETASRLSEMEATSRLREIETKFPDIYADFEFDEKTGEPTGGALLRFKKLVDAGFADDEAAKMVRATMPAAAPAPEAPKPPAPRDVKPPPSVAAMGDGASNAARATTDVKPASFDEAYRAAMRKAQAEEGA
jgi:hypothetical protein